MILLSSPLLEQFVVLYLLERVYVSQVLATEEYGGDENLHDSGRQSVTPYVHGRIGMLYCCRPSKSFSRAFSYLRSHYSNICRGLF
jgi:hypothetical protein